MIIFLILLLVISVVVNFFLVVSLRKSFYTIDVLESWIVDFKDMTNKLYNNLKLIDERGMFEKDDDVGVTFIAILDIIKKCNERVQIKDYDRNRPSNTDENFKKEEKN